MPLTQVNSRILQGVETCNMYGDTSWSPIMDMDQKLGHVGIEGIPRCSPLPTQINYSQGRQ